MHATLLQLCCWLSARKVIGWILPSISTIGLSTLIFSNSIAAAAALYCAHKESGNSDLWNRSNRLPRSPVETTEEEDAAHEQEEREEAENCTPGFRQDDDATEEENDDDVWEEAKGEEPGDDDDDLRGTAATELLATTTGCCPEAKLEIEMESWPAARRRVSMAALR